jgi:hypothetical protein
MNAGEGCRAAALRSNAKAGLILSGNGKERKQRGGLKIAGIYLEQVM